MDVNDHAILSNFTLKTQIKVKEHVYCIMIVYVSKSFSFFLKALFIKTLVSFVIWSDYGIKNGLYK